MLLDDDDERSESELVRGARAGEQRAVRTLYVRHWRRARASAWRLARTSADADDLAADAFLRVYSGLTNGRGPDRQFGAYLEMTVRNCYFDHVKRQRRLRLIDELPDIAAEPEVDPIVRREDNERTARAFASLPERWQRVLWATAVEGRKPKDVAPELGLSANATAALSVRARDALRTAYLAAHVAPTAATGDCRWAGEHLAAWVRGKTAKRNVARLESHVADCGDCRQTHFELRRCLPALA